MFSLYAYIKHVTPGEGPFWPKGHNLNKLGKVYIPNIKALGLHASEKKIFFMFSLYKPT